MIVLPTIQAVVVATKVMIPPATLLERKSGLVLMKASNRFMPAMVVLFYTVLRVSVNCLFTEQKIMPREHLSRTERKIQDTTTPSEKVFHKDRRVDAVLHL